MSMIGKKEVVLLLCSVLSTGCLSGIDLIGLDRDGEKLIKVPPKEYAKKMGDSMAEVHDSALIAASVMRSQGADGLRLKSFMIGLGVEGKADMAGIVTLGASSRIRLIFTPVELQGVEYESVH